MLTGSILPANGSATTSANQRSSRLCPTNATIIRSSSCSSCSDASPSLGRPTAIVRRKHDANAKCSSCSSEPRRLGQLAGLVPLASLVHKQSMHGLANRWSVLCFHLRQRVSPLRGQRHSQGLQVRQSRCHGPVRLVVGPEVEPVQLPLPRSIVASTIHVPNEPTASATA